MLIDEPQHGAGWRSGGCGPWCYRHGVSLSRIGARRWPAVTVILNHSRSFAFITPFLAPNHTIGRMVSYFSSSLEAPIRSGKHILFFGSLS